MRWELAFLGVAILLFLVAFSLWRWGRGVRNPERRNPWIFLHPGGGGS